MKKKNYLLFCMLLICGILFGNASQIHADVGTLTINRAGIVEESTESEVSVTASTGEKITLSNSFNLDVENCVEVKFKPTGCAIYNLVEMPGAITKITIKMPASGEFTSIDWTVNLPNEGENSIVFFIMNSLETKNLSNAGESISWNIDADKGLKYFGMSFTGGSKAQFESLVVEYQAEAGSSHTVTLSDRGATSTLSGATVTLPSKTPAPACATLGWEFAGWSLAETGVTAGDIIPAGPYTPQADVTLYAVYKQESLGPASLTVRNTDFENLSTNVTEVQTITVTSTAGDEISIKADISGHPQGPRLSTRNNMSLHNISALPGAITKITVAGASFTKWTPAFSTNAALGDLSEVPGMPEGKEGTQSNGELTWSIDADNDFRYFRMAPPASSRVAFSYVTVEYESTATSVIYDTNPDCGEPTLAVSPLDPIALEANLGSSAQTTLTITGSNLTSTVDILVLPAQMNSVFIVTPNTIEPDSEGTVNQEVVVKFSPMAVNVSSGKLRVSTESLNFIEINLSGTGKEVSVNKPTLTEIADLKCTSFYVYWSQVNDADGYYVHVEAAGEEIPGSPFVIPNTDYAAPVTGLTPETEYTVYVEAYVGDVVSEPSNTLKKTTPPCSEYTITLNNRGTIVGTLTGVTVTLPEASPSYDCMIAGWSYYGWTTSSFFPSEYNTFSGEYTPTQDRTMYAVFQKEGELSLDPECEPAPGMSIPYTQNFDEEAPPTLPAGWEAEDVNADGLAWRVIANYDGGPLVAQSLPNFLGMGFSSGSTVDPTSMDDWVFSPMLRLEAGKQYKVKFSVRIPASYLVVDMKLLVGTSQSSSSMTGQPLWSEILTGEEFVGYKAIERIVQVENTGDYTFGFHCQVGTFAYPTAIDDFSVDIHHVVADKVFPENGATDVLTNTAVYAEFNQDITDKIIDLSLITIGGDNVSATLKDGNKIEIEHDVLDFNKTYTVNIPAGVIEGFAGHSWTFTTVTANVELYDMSIEDGSTGVWPNTVIGFRFNKPVSVANAGGISINNGATGVQPRVDGNYLYIDHDPLPRDLTYTVTIAPGAIQGWDGTSLSFSVIKSGTIPDVDALYQLRLGFLIVRALSENGRYLTAKSGGDNGVVVWDLLEGESFYPVRPDALGDSFDISNDGIVVGSIGGELSSDGSYWHQGKLYEMEDKDASIRAITPDGKYMAGGSYKEGVKDMMLPTVWHVKEDYTVEKEIWAHPEDTRQAIITDISADGTTAVGRINLERFDVAYVPIYWPSKTEYVLLDEETAIAGEFTCMSENGEYAGLRAGGAYFFEMETGTQTSVSGDIINGITNNGFAVMASGNALGGSSYVYSKAIGSMSFNAYVNKYLGHLDSEMFEKAKGVSSGNTLLMGISHDGKNLAIHHEDSEIGLMCAYVLHLEDGIEVDAKPRPTGLTTAVNREKRNEVELAWTAPNTQETITGYEIYADNNLRTTVSATDLSYTDTNVPAGRIAYTIVATYDGDMSSAHSDPAVAIVIDNYNIPFADGFESGSIETNYWTAGGWDTSVVTLGFGVEQTVGLGVTISRKNVDFSGTLTSKPLDATGLDKVYLSYMMLANYFDWQSELFTDDTFFVDVSTDGVNWTNVQSYKPERFNDWRAEIVDLSDVVAGKLFNFRFRIEGINKLPNDYKMWLFDYITVDTTGPQGTTVPGDLIFAIEEDDEILRLGWEDPAGLYGLTHSKTFARKAFGNGGANIIAVQAFDKDEISLYQGMSIQSITTTIGNRLVASATPSFKTAVFINGERVDATPVTSFEFGKSNTFLLDEPILITPDITDLKVGIEVVSHHADEWPLTADESYYVVKGKGDLYSENGGTIWKKLSDVVISGDPSRTQSNWIIVANLSKTDNNKARTPFILGYNIYKDDVKLNTDLEHASNYTAPFAEGVYSLRAFSMGTEKLSAQSQGVVVKLVSIDHVGDKSAVAVYPNPASVYVAIDGEYSKVTIFDIKGNAVLVSKPQPQIPVEHLSRGIYVIQVETPKGISSHKLIIK